MARVLLALLLAPLAVLAAPVLPCAPGTLTDYVNLGSDGCTIGDKVLFDFIDLTIPNGAVPIDFASIFVTPVSSEFVAELRFAVDGSAGPHQFLDAHFAYSVTTNGFPMVGLRLEMTGASATGDGATTVITDACIGDVFNFDVCFADTATLITAATAFDAVTSDETTFPPTNTLGVANDIGIDGGLGGSARLGTVVNHISEVPEPATLLLCAAGLIAAVWLRRRH
jgi:hypothetical protein